MPSATPSAPLAPAVAGTVDEQAVAAQTSSSAKTSQRAFFLFDDTPTKEDLKHPLEHFQARRAFFAKLVIAETWMLVALVMLLVIVIPLTQTQYLFKTQPFVMPLDFT
ncbi:MAG: hypothetical protein EBZ69_04370, partial [Alphaproteobacteria bacterium]|nr:hypothetical protein [Alphaproteobacteria bacterium]NDG05351.1 hypothetical protein [Alphaproteobacteria bacterium]